ncbi:MAG TPA: LuxR C-terminal-related transcriptional regulator [Euzebyales bacterium]|nr:LuxR C-terminal-related transcriptional regulator [Euzebyales bacterium]
MPLTIVVAPAGWGKTTLLAQWATNAATEPVAWLTLDEADNDPVRFWIYLVTALQDDDPHLAVSALTALRVPGLDPLDVAVPTLINDLTAAGGHRVLVLDDYHLVTDRRIHEAVEFFLTYLPSGLRVVIAARFDPQLPIARLRARGQLVEIRQVDLAFTPPEAAGLVTDVAEDALDPPHISGLVERTEGWAAGLHLAALTLRGTADPAGRAEVIRGDDRHVMDYLGHEVLAALPDDQRRFVLRSSVLDRLCGALCDVALERDGSGRVLAALERAGLFLVALDEQREWYRYHRLFRDAMRRELTRTEADDERAILERAAGWWQDHGDVEAAVRHLLAAGRQGRAAELLAASDDEFLNSGEAGTYLQLADELDDALVHGDPRLAIAMAAAAGFSGRIDRVAGLLDVAEASLTADDRPPHGWSSARAAIATLRATFGRPAELADAVDGARIAVDLEVDPDLDGYVISRLALGVVLAGLDQHHEASVLLDEAWRRAGVDLPVFTRLLVAGALATSLVAIGRRDDARMVIDASSPAADHLEAAVGRAAGGAVAMLRAAAGRLAHQAGDVETARSLLEHATDMARAAAHPSLTAGILVTLADARLAVGDRSGARAALAEAREIADNDTVFPATLRRVEVAEQRLGRGAVRAARRGGALVEELTDRELSVLRALQGPLSQREIGRELFLSVNTVKGYTRSLYRKLGVAARADALRRGRELGLI